MPLRSPARSVRAALACLGVALAPAFVPALALAPASGGLAGCEVYDAPPRVSIVGAVEGVLSGDGTSLDLELSEGVDPATLRIKVVRLETDIEGMLADEDADEATVLTPLFEWVGDASEAGGVATGGTGELVRVEGKARALRIRPTGSFPVGPKLAVLVEPGLADLAGNTTGPRERIAFSYQFTCQGGVGTQVFESGVYFFLLDVVQPVGVQIQLFVSFSVDPVTGQLIATATNADRDREQECPMACDPDSEVCRLLPEPACVAPSTKAGSVDEYSDFVPNVEPPVGYSFVLQGCAQDLGADKAGVATLPAELVVQQPAVTASGLVMTSEFGPDASGVLRGNGSLTAAEIFLGTIPTGPGQGTFTARLVPPDEVPPGVPAPPAQ